MFQIGDLIVHPMHGAGVIDDVIQEKVAGKVKEYYVFKMPIGGLTLKIPTANCQAIGIRSIISPTEAEAFFAGIQCELEQALSGKPPPAEKRGP